MRRLGWALGLAVSLVLVAPLAAGPRDGPPRNIILIGWDGAQREHVHQALDRGELPNLKQLASEGALVDIDITTGATDTKAGWSQILSGYKPEVTGVYSNGRYQPVPEGYSVFERLKAFFGPEKFAALAAIGKNAHCGENDPPQKVEITAEQAAAAKGGAKAGAKASAKAGAKAKGKGPLTGGKIVEEDGKFYRVVSGKPYYNMSKACDQWVFGLMLDDKVGEQALAFLDQYKDKPFFFFVHFAEVDHKGHAAGENSKEYNDALISGDTWTGKIMEKLKALGLYDRTLIYVTADHGFDEDKKSHGDAPSVFLGTNDPKVCRNGDRADVTPTILARFGMDLAKIEPPLDGRPLTAPSEAPTPEKANK